MVTERHRKFARELVEMARRNGMRSVRCEIALAFENGNNPHDFEQVIVSWAAGRHGVASRISIETRHHEAITEAEGRSNG